MKSWKLLLAGGLCVALVSAASAQQCGTSQVGSRNRILARRGGGQCNSSQQAQQQTLPSQLPPLNIPTSGLSPLPSQAPPAPASLSYMMPSYQGAPVAEADEDEQLADSTTREIADMDPRSIAALCAPVAIDKRYEVIAEKTMRGPNKLAAVNREIPSNNLASLPVPRRSNR